MDASTAPTNLLQQGFFVDGQTWRLLVARWLVVFYWIFPDAYLVKDLDPRTAL